MEKKRPITIRRLLPEEKLPQELVEGFQREVPGIDDEYLRFSVFETSTRIGAFDGEKMVVFACARAGLADRQRQANRLYFTSRYVTPQYRRRGISQKLAWAMVSEAKQLGKKSVVFYGLMAAPRREFKKMQEKILQRKNSRHNGGLKLRLFETHGHTHGVARISKRMRV